MTKRFGFTLAEVLITLGIIGVVAAMTIPTLVKNYQKTVWVNQLKKSVSTLEQGFQKMLADEGVDKLEDTTTFKSITEFRCAAGSLASTCPDFYNNLKKYFIINDLKMVRKEKPLYSTNYSYNTSWVTQLGDGSFLTSPAGGFFYRTPYKANCDAVYEIGGKLCEMVATLYIDINGNKKPNEWGRDIHGFVLSSEGHLFPVFGKDHAIFESGGDPDWANSFNYYKSKACNGCSEYESDGCAARIIENGWKMDY